MDSEVFLLAALEILERSPNPEQALADLVQQTGQDASQSTGFQGAPYARETWETPEDAFDREYRAALYGGADVLHYLREAGEDGLADVLQYGWREGPLYKGGPRKHWYGTDADKGQKRTQISEPHSGRTKHKVDNVVASLKADIENGKIEDSTLAVLKDMDRDQLSLLRHYLGLGERQQPGEKKVEFRERLEGKLREKAEEAEEGAPEPAPAPVAPTPAAPLSTGDIAKHARVAPRTVSKWIDSGRLPGTRDPQTGNRTVAPADFVAFLNDHGFPIPPELADVKPTPLDEFLQKVKGGTGGASGTGDDQPETGGAVREPVPVDWGPMGNPGRGSHPRDDSGISRGGSEGTGSPEGRPASPTESRIHDLIASTKGAHHTLSGLHQSLPAWTKREDVQAALDSLEAAGKIKRHKGNYVAADWQPDAAEVEDDIQAHVDREFARIPKAKRRGMDIGAWEQQTADAYREKTGFTGTDPQGREWRDGELVPAGESQPSPIDNASGTSTLPVDSSQSATSGGKTMDVKASPRAIAELRNEGAIPAGFKAQTLGSMLVLQGEKGHIEASDGQWKTVDRKGNARAFDSLADAVNHLGGPRPAAKQDVPAPIPATGAPRQITKGAMKRNGTALQVGSATADTVATGDVVEFQGNQYRVTGLGNEFKADGFKQRYLYVEPASATPAPTPAAPVEKQPAAPVQMPTGPLGFTAVEKLARDLGVGENQAFHVAMYLAKDGRTATADEVVARVKDISTPRKPRPTDDLQILTTPDEDFGTGDRGRNATPTPAEAAPAPAAAPSGASKAPTLPPGVKRTKHGTRSDFAPPAGPLAGLALTHGKHETHPVEGDGLQFELTDQAPEVAAAIRKAMKSPKAERIFLTASRNPTIKPLVDAARQDEQAWADSVVHDNLVWDSNDHVAGMSAWSDEKVPDHIDALADARFRPVLDMIRKHVSWQEAQQIHKETDGERSGYDGSAIFNAEGIRRLRELAEPRAKEATQKANSARAEKDAAWKKKVDAAHAEARTSGKRVLIDTRVETDERPDIESSQTIIRRWATPDGRIETDEVYAH